MTMVNLTIDGRLRLRLEVLFWKLLVQQEFIFLPYAIILIYVLKVLVVCVW